MLSFFIKVIVPFGLGFGISILKQHFENKKLGEYYESLGYKRDTMKEKYKNTTEECDLNRKEGEQSDDI